MKEAKNYLPWLFKENELAIDFTYISAQWEFGGPGIEAPPSGYIPLHDGNPVADYAPTPTMIIVNQTI